jgi:micrococcal nuclease
MSATSRTCLALGLASLVLSANPARAQHPVQHEVRCLVRKVVDGDTFYCGDGRKVRLIGVDSPEGRQDPFGAEARRALAGMLPLGLVVRLEHDVASTDRYGRLLAYAWDGQILVNEAMVRDGWAVLYTVPPNVKYAERFERAQSEARARGTGLWAHNGFACLPKDFRRRACVTPP